MDKGLQIAIIVNSSWNIYNFRKSFIYSLILEGFSVTCFAPLDESTKQLEEEGIQVIPLMKLNRKGTNPISDIQLTQEIKGLIKKCQIDLVINYTIKPNIYGSIAAGSLGIPSIAVVTGLGYTFLSKGVASIAAKVLYKYAFAQNNMTVFQNYDDRELFINMGLSRKAKSTVILGSGIDLEYFQPARYTEKTYQVLFIGRLLNDKGIRELISGFNQFAEDNSMVTLQIVGNVDEGNPASLSKEQVISVQSERIQFLGYKEDIRPFIENADVVILPSYREGLPRTMLEALAMSKPVITTDVPGCREVVVHGKNGFKIPVKNSSAIADALHEFYQLKDSEIIAMGQFSRNLAEEKFSTDIVNERMLLLIRDLLTI